MALPRIIYGAAWKKESTTDLVVKAVLQGFRAVDTACQPKHYREDLVGEALQILSQKHEISREQIWLQTKFTSINGQDRNKPLPYDPDKSVKEQVQTSFATSLRQLHTTYLDSYILHSPLRTIEETMEAWRVLATLQDEGKVKLIGVSNTYDVDTLESLSSERKVQVVQNRWYERNSFDKDVYEYCKQNGIMYQSFWTLTGSPTLLGSSAVATLAEKAGATPAQVVYKFAQLHGIVPLAGSTNEKHMRDGVEVENIVALEPGTEMARLESKVFGL